MSAFDTIQHEHSLSHPDSTAVHEAELEESRR